MILGSSCFFLRPETFEDIRISSLNNRLVIKTAMFFLEQLLINICVKSDRESRSFSVDSSKDVDDTIAEADTLEVAVNVSSPLNDAGTPACVCCPPKDCWVDTLLAEVDVSVGHEAAEANVSSPPNSPLEVEVDGPWCEANVCDAFGIGPKIKFVI